MSEKFVRKLTRASSHSYVLTIPKKLIREFRWQEQQKLEIVWGGRNKELIVRDWKRK